MNIEEVNSDYTKLKEKMVGYEQAVTKKEKEMLAIKKEYFLYSYTLLEAKEEGNEEKIKDSESKLEETKTKMEEVKAIFEKRRKILENSKNRIDQTIESVKKDPEIGKQINEALLKRYQRQENKLANEKYNTVKQKVGLISFRNLISEHPSIANNLKGVLISVKTYNDIEGKLASISTSEKAQFTHQQIEELKSKREESKVKFQKNINLLYEFCEKNKIGKDEVDNYIGMMLDNGISQKHGQVDLDNSFDKSVKKLDIQINRYEKRIKNYEALRLNTENNISRLTKVDTENKIENNVEEISEKSEEKDTENIVNNNVEKDVENNIDSDVKNNIENNAESYQIENQIKWWQFGKRFKNWWQFRKQKVLTSGDNIQATKTENAQQDRIENVPQEISGNTQQDRIENVPQEISGNTQQNKIENAQQENQQKGDSFRYELVREAMESQEKDDYKYVIEQKKQSNINKQNESKDNKEEER